jgi:hypothetical protein
MGRLGPPELGNAFVLSIDLDSTVGDYEGALRRCLAETRGVSPSPFRISRLTTTMPSGGRVMTGSLRCTPKRSSADCSAPSSPTPAVLPAVRAAHGPDVHIVFGQP